MGHSAPTSAARAPIFSWSRQHIRRHDVVRIWARPIAKPIIIGIAPPCIVHKVVDGHRTSASPQLPYEELISCQAPVGRSYLRHVNHDLSHHTLLRRHLATRNTTQTWKIRTCPFALQTALVCIHRGCPASLCNFHSLVVHV